MPTIQRIFTLEVTPERFLDACSQEELIELELLLGSERYRDRMDRIKKLEG